ncbi:FAD-containing oxidoreductase [Jeotgalibaca sp. A127]|uniref:FAD-containing oxidoreductase n=1 Tax=Jeotgalibaca sp. A127 TaxID=3457324 RepID=UPI003FD1549A
MNYDVIIIGWGKAGKTLAKQFATSRKKVAIIEKTKAMTGGTCINIACIPTKVLAVDSATGISFDQAFIRRNLVVQKLNETNYANLANEDTVDIYFGEGSFKNDEVIVVRGGDESIELTGELVFINTGAQSILPDIAGLKDSNFVYDSTQLQELPTVPQTLGILGAGNIGLEFASIYAGFGSAVTLIESSSKILKREEPEIREAILEVLANRDIQLLLETEVVTVHNDDSGIHLETKAGEMYTFDVLLVATGRKPNVEGLGLENTSIKQTENGGIWTNEFLRTSVDNVFALGDVRGEEQFTYASLDDARIINSYLYGDHAYTLAERKNLPSSVFIEPPFARVGLTEEEAIEAGLLVKTNVLPVAKMPRAHVINDKRGLFKAVIEEGSNRIVGASLFGQESPEIINIIKLAMDNDLSSTVLKNQVFTHPTMAENLNDLFQ